MAWRNVIRNARRTLLTVSATAISAMALILFSGLVGALMAGLETNLVQKVGHFRLYKEGHPARFGAGNPALHAVRNYSKVAKALRDDPWLAERLRAVEPVIFTTGIIQNEAESVTRTFFGQGMRPSGRDLMMRYNPYRLREFSSLETAEVPLRDDDDEGGAIGVEMVRLLQICDEMPEQHCKDEVKGPRGTGKDPALVLYGASAGGTPNRVELRVRGAKKHDSRVGNENYVFMTLGLARRLIYGEERDVASTLSIQMVDGLNRTDDRAAIERVIRAGEFPLEVRDIDQVWPQYLQVKKLLDTIFLFLGVLLGSTVLFTVGNTMTMNVMERVQEIGQTRAMGLRRRQIMGQFLYEGTLMGLIGALAGLVLAWTVATAINAYGVTWEPPGSETPVYITLLLSNNVPFVILSLVMMTVAAALSSVPPARRASRMVIVDALRHV